MNKQQIQDLSDDEIQNLYDQYNEMESKSVNDDIIHELLAMEMDIRDL